MTLEYNLSGCCKNLEPLTNEEFIALFLNPFEKSLNSIQLGNKSDIIKAFRHHWLHENKKAILELDGNVEKVAIIDIDEKGRNVI